MRQVLEEACLKNGFDADSYQLSNQKRHVDLALPFRLSGLPNNATLEMVQAGVKCTPNSKVTIALQIPNGSRMEKEFPVSTSLFSILESFSSSFGDDLTTTSDSSTPSCSYMNRKYTGPEELQRTTLSSIGISSGKCLIRYQRIELTKEQLEEIAARVASEAAEKQALLSNYAKRKRRTRTERSWKLIVWHGLKKRYGWKENGGKLWREKSQRNRWKLAVIPRKRHFQSSRGTC